MSQADFYPPGAYNDPRAPYNEVEPTMEECPDCDGFGKLYYAVDIDLDTELECTKLAYDLIALTEEQARARHQHFIRGKVCTCPTCNGSGEVEQEPEEPDDFDERDFYRDQDY